jgi:hypothetical protein
LIEGSPGEGPPFASGSLTKTEPEISGRADLGIWTGEPEITKSSNTFRSQDEKLHKEFTAAAEEEGEGFRVVVTFGGLQVPA